MIYAMSDIHGCLEQLKEKMNLVDLDGNNKLLFLGDYIDYGSESGPVLRFVYDLQKQYGKDKVIVLKGNHEAMLLEWIDEYNKPVTKDMEELSYDSWLETDEKHHFNTFRTLVTEAQFLEFSDFSKTASYAKKNAEAVRIILETSGELIKWMRSMELFYQTEKQIFVHAGVDEEAEEYWEWGSGEEIFLWKFPASKGRFVKTVIAGHVGTDSLARDKMFHSIFYDGKSHYYIDGSVYNRGRLLLLGYDENNQKYYQIEKRGKFEIEKYDFIS